MWNSGSQLEVVFVVQCSNLGFGGLCSIVQLSRTVYVTIYAKNIPVSFFRGWRHWSSIRELRSRSIRLPSRSPRKVAVPSFICFREWWWTSVLRKGPWLMLSKGKGLPKTGVLQRPACWPEMVLPHLSSDKSCARTTRARPTHVLAHWPLQPIWARTGVVLA